MKRKRIESVAQSLVALFTPSPPKVATRMYQAARSSRATMGWGTGTTSADGELRSSLTALRNRSRALIRDSAYAKRAKRIVQNNVIGAGVKMQAQVMSSRNRLRTPINDAIEEAWNEWSTADSCHTGGSLHFSDLERAAMGEVFEAGEALIRKHYTPFGNSKVPFALEFIEPERLADDLASVTQASATAPGAALRMGIEVDAFYRPVAYWLRTRHPGDFLPTARSDRVERVPAEDMIHLRIIDRWPQTRGAPWLHTVARKLNDMDAYSEAEVSAARGAASFMATIETPDAANTLGQEQVDGSVEFELEPLTIRKLAPGEHFNAWAPNRPNAALDQFMRYMLREVAAGADVSYESISRDYSQSNYSSSRLALLDDRDLWRVLQLWWIRSFREPLHRIFLRQAVLAGTVDGLRVDEYIGDRKRFEAALFKPRGWSWIDPTKEVEAASLAVRAGFTTVSDVIAATGEGKDLEDVLNGRQRELDMMEQMDLSFDTDPEFAPDGSVRVDPADLVQPAAPAEPAPQDSPARLVAIGGKRDGST